MLLIDLLKQFLKNMNTVKMWDKIFNKNLFTTEKEEENFRSSNTYWICEKLIEDEKVRDQDHITGRYRGTAHRSCNVNLNLAKNVSVIFCNLKGYDSHLIMNGIGKCNVKVNIIPNRWKKYMDFTIN